MSPTDKDPPFYPYSAEFLRSPDSTSLCTTCGKDDVWLIPVRITYYTGAPLAQDSPVQMWDDTWLDDNAISTQIADENGIALFPWPCSKYKRFSGQIRFPSVRYWGDLGYAVVGEATYRIYRDLWTAPLQTQVMWPPARAVLPRDSRIIISIYHTLRNGLHPWPDNNPAFPSLIWECSAAQAELTPLPDQGRLADGQPNLIRRAELRIPANASIQEDALSITIRPQDPDSSLEPVTVYWRVASALPARQLYITPALDATIQPVNCAMIVTATLVDEDRQPVSGQAVRWSWQRGLLAPPEPLGKGITDANGQTRAKLTIHNGVNFGDILVATSGSLRVSCPITFNAKAGALPTDCKMLDPTPDSQLSIEQPHPVQGAYRFAERELAKGKKVTWSTDPYTDAVSFLPAIVDAPWSGFPLVSVDFQATAGAKGLTVALLAVSPNPLAPHGMDVMRVEGIQFAAAADSELLIEYPQNGASLTLGKPLTAKAIFVDKAGAPIKHVKVTWRWENGSAGADLPTVDPATQETDASGVSEVTIQANTLVTADLRATATDPGTGAPCEALARQVGFFIGEQ
ncbi:MAG TPA: Ig-like domain-containing protein [Dyella sp.]|uniref:Ig-like domain-containing protein n=1 Tax=Dyella sp. TaxID=1869338 RepID=UPI002F930DEC